MGQLAMTIVGGVVGSFFGMPQLGMMIGGMLGSALFGPTIKGPRLNDLNVSASTYGNAIPVLYGTYRMGSNMIWTAGIKEKKKKKRAGKGGPKQVTYTYSASFAVAFCVGPAQEILRIWADSKLISGRSQIDTSGTGFIDIVKKASGSKSGKSKKSKIKFRVYYGDEDQLPDSIIVAKEGAGKVPGYRGLVYIVFENMPLEDYGNRIPSISAEITKKPTANFPYLTPQNSDGTYSSANYSYIDFDSNKLVRKIDGDHVTYNYSNMTEISRVDVEGSTSAMMKGGEYYVGTLGNTNYKPYAIYDADSGNLIRTIGGYDNLGGNYHIKDGISLQANDAQARFWAWGEINSIRVPNPYWIDEIYFVGEEGSHGPGECIYRVPDGKLVHNLDSKWSSSWTGRTFVNGIESAAGSEYYRFHGDGTGGIIRTCQYIPPHCNTEIISDEGTNQWTIRYDPRLKYEVFDPITTASLPSSVVSDYTSLSFSAACYDRSDDSTIVFATASKSGATSRKIAFKIARDGTIKWASRILRTSGTEGDLPDTRIRRSRIEGGEVCWLGAGTTRFYTIDCSNGKVTYTGDIGSNIGTSNEWAFGAWDDLTEAWVGNGTSYGAGAFIRSSSSDAIEVRDVVQDICIRTGVLTAGDIDVSDVDGQMTGYLISRECTAKDCLQQLATAFYFDGVESDYILKFVKRGNPKKGTILEKRMGFVEGRDISLRETRMQELELPMRLTLNYADRDRDYQVASQFSKRITNPFPTMHSNKQDVIELPIAMDATTAKQITDKGLKMSWTNRVTASAMLPWEMLKYDPTDVLEFLMDSGTSYLLRLTKVNLGVDYRVEVEGVTEDSIAYVSTVVGDGGNVPPQDAGDANPAKAVICNTPLLRDTDDTQGIGSVYYMGATPVIPGSRYSTSILMESQDGSEYNEIDFLEAGVNLGVCLDALPDTVSWGSIDNNTVLRVRMWDAEDTLESITEGDLLAGRNGAIIGNEIIQFQNAVLGDDGLYHLSGILRARRGSNKWVNGHAANERFILLADDASLTKEYHDLAIASSTFAYKAIVAGAYEADSVAVGQKFEPNDLKPYTPEDFQISDDGTTITVTFTRRSRITDDLRDYGGDVTFRDGNVVTAKMRYVAYFGDWSIGDDDPKSQYEADPSAPSPGPGLSGEVAVWDSGTSNYTDLQIQIPLSELTAAADNHFVLYVWQTGFVDGFEKRLKFERLGQDRWNVTEAY